MGMRRGYFRYTAAVAVALASLLLGGKALAAPQVLTMTPTSASPVIAAGTTYSGSLQVINNGQTGYNYIVYSTPYHVSGEEYTPSFNVVRNAPEVSTWFNTSVASGFSKPGQATTVKYTISVPVGTPAGGYYATIFAQTKSQQTGTTGVTINERVGEIFYIQVPGPVAQKGQVVGWSAPWLQSAPLTAAVRLSNSGGLHYSATTQVTVRDIFGHPKYVFKSTHEVLPQTTRRIPVSWDKAPPLGLFKVTGTASFLKTTQTLPTHWVLLMSNSFRVGVLAVFVVIIALRVGQVILKRQKHSKSRH